MVPRIKGLFRSNTVGMLILVVLIMTFLYSSYTSQQQLSQARHLTRVTQCQARVNNQFNAVLKYNSTISSKTSDLNDKNQRNLSTMVAKIGEGIKKNNDVEIRDAINDFNTKRGDLDKQRIALNQQRAQYPNLPEEQCK